MGKKLTYEFVKTEFDKEGCVLLETEYIKSTHPMNYICSCGNISKIRWDKFNSGQRCKECGYSNRKITNRLSYEFVKSEFEKRGYKLLSKEYNFEYDAVLVYNLDRLTRNWDDVTMIERFFRENWGSDKLISCSDSIDLSNASGRLMFRIKMATNCYMPEDMREKQRIGIERAKKQGKFKGRPRSKKD